MSLDTWSGGLPTAAESADCDAWLWRVMQSAKNKAMIARLEDSLHLFVSDKQQTQLPFPPRNAFHRKVCYLVARRYGLAHRIEQHVDPASTQHSSPAAQTHAVRLVLLKTPHSAIPRDTLAQLADGLMPADLTQLHTPKVVVQPLQKESSPSLEGPNDNNPRSVPSSTTFLRRPRTADGKTPTATKAVPTNNQASTSATVKSISEEDYRKARARIFKKSTNHSDSPDTDPEHSSEGIEPTRVMRMGVLAKGPVEGTTGFDRRRNRRIAPNNSAQSPLQDRPQKVSSTDKSDTSKPISTTENASNRPRQTSSQSKGSKESRGQDHVTRQGSLVTTVVDAGTSSAVPTAPSNGAGARRSTTNFATHDHSQIDLQDPDFDRRYDKWAVRAPPPPAHPSQQIPIPGFSQLLYPYAVHATTPHIQPSTMHLRNVNDPGGQAQQGSANQYHSLHVHQAPLGAVMFQHFGEGVGGLTADYGARETGIHDHTSQYQVPSVRWLNASHSREISSLQHQGVPPQLTRNPSPAYGLDSTVDFPPLP